MLDAHELPSVLSPVGSICYPLFIPDDPHWHSLLLGAIRQLAESTYYSQSDFMPIETAEVCENWLNITLEPLVQAMNDESPCTVTQPEIYQLNTERDTATQTLLSANQPNAIIWNQGNFHPTFTTRISLPVDGIYIVTANFRVTCVNAITWSVILRKDGSQELLRISEVATTAWQVSFSWQFTSEEHDYIEILIVNSQNATLQIATPICACTLLVIPNGA